MNTTRLKGISKLFIITFLIIVVIIGGVMTSVSVLKEEAVNANIRVIKLQANTFSENLSHTINTLDLLFNSLTSIVVIEQDKKHLSEQFSIILKTNPHIRSINFLENDTVILSSNPKNINTLFKTNEFYPKPFFNQSILRVGNTYVGRDLYEMYSDIESDSNLSHAPNFIPISKKIQQTNDKVYTLVIALNPDYFINAFTSKLEANTYVDILRMDDILLASSQENIKTYNMPEINTILQQAKEKNMASGMSSFEQTPYLVAYSLTPNYPLTIGVRMKYEESLQDWESKRYDFFILTTGIVLVCVLLVLFLLFLYYSKHQEELKRHKLQIKNQKKFKILFENNHFLSAIINKEGEIKEINQKALTMLNHSFKEIENTPFWELFCFNPDDKKWLEETILNYQLTEHTIQKELTVTDGNNNTLIIEFMIVSIDHEDIKELVLLGSDITQRKQHEYQIKEAYTVFQNTQDGIVITNKKGEIINVNKAFERCSGYTKEEMLCKNPNILKSGMHDDAFYQAFWEQLINKGLWEGELINKKKNGELWSEWITINTVYNEQGEVTNYIGVFHDTTAQKKHEKELREKEDMLMQQAKMASMGEMIENIAHQWRQPLSVISTISTGIQLKYEYGIFDEKEVLNDLKSINTSAQFLSQTIDDFRNFLTKTKIKRIFKLNSAITKALNILQSKFKNREIQVINTIKDLDCTGFENELIQVFLNILNNTKDAFESNDIKDKYIFIEANKEDDHIIILFKDSAGGIPEKIINKIFDPYFTTKHQSQGTGIGLYMSKQIIDNHFGGELSATNISYTYENILLKGACFKIKLKA